jgi:hypothetical protein
LSEEKLANFLKTGRDWSRMMTSVPGIFVLKLTSYKRSPSRLAVEINPVAEDGKPSKRRGLVLRSNSELKAFNEAFQVDKVSKLVIMLDSINPKVKAAKRRKGEIIEL